MTRSPGIPGYNAVRMYPPDQIQVRIANASDAPSILQLLAAAFAPYQSSYTPGAYADTVLTPPTLRARLLAMHVLVATRNESVVGTISAALDGQEGHLRGMAVLPDWHGAGIAAKLLAAIEQWLRTQGCRHITLDTTLPLAPAMRFYEKNGYSRSGKITDFFGMSLIEFEKEL